MKILITGAGGFIGSALARALAASTNAAGEHELILLDHFNDGSTFANGKRRFFGSYANLAGVRGRIEAIDICSREFAQLLAAERPELVYHFAAISDTTVYDEAAVFRTNLAPFYELLAYCKCSGARVVYASSASVYGRREGLCRVGRDEAPINPYAFSKLKMDEAAAGANAVGLRYFNVYGPGEFYKDATASMALQWGLALLGGRPLRMFDDSARTLRDFVYIADVTRVNLAAASAAPGVYNVGSGQQASFAELAGALQRHLGAGTVEQIPNPYRANYQYSTLAELDGELVRPEDMRALEAGVAAYAPVLRELGAELAAGRLKEGWRL